MEATKQSEDVMKRWTEAQTKMWSDWLKAMQGVARPPSTQIWEGTVEAWDRSIQNTLDAQLEWTRHWAETFAVGSNSPKEMVDWAKQGQEMLSRLIDTQKLLWRNWFEIVKKLDPSDLGEAWQRQGPKLLQVWEEAVRKSLEAQQEWTRRQRS